MDENEVKIVTPEEFNELSQQIASAGNDQGAITSLLSKATTGYTDLFATHASLTDENQRLKEENEKLKKYNWELFMERGQQITGALGQGAKAEKKTPAQERAETITIEELLKEE